MTTALYSMTDLMDSKAAIVRGEPWAMAALADARRTAEHGLLQPPFSFLLLTRLLSMYVNRVRTEQSALEIKDVGMEQATEAIVST